MTLAEKIEQKEKERQTRFQTIFWKPQPGEVLEGTVRALGTTITTYGEQEYADVETADGTVYTVFLTRLLQDLFDAEGISEGDRIAIKFVGIKASAKNKNKTYKDFVVVKDEGGETE